MVWFMNHLAPVGSFQADSFVHANAFARVGSWLRVAKGWNHGAQIAPERRGIARMLSAGAPIAAYAYKAWLSETSDR